MSTSLTICICTFRRAHVASTLASIARLNIPFDCTLRIIVADNDDETSAQVTVATAAAQYNLDVRYLHAPARNLSVARNACLDAATGDYIAFIDDDEVVTADWLTAMLARILETGAAIILGPIQAVYADDAPPWLLRGNFHSTSPVIVKGTITTFYASNVLMRRAAIGSLRFDPRLAATRGEDADFFSRARAAGAGIAYAPDALALEGIPPQRATLRWLRERRIRLGQSHAAMLMRGPRTRIASMLITSATILRSFILMVLSCLSPLNRRRWYLRVVFHLAVLRELHRLGAAHG